MASCLCSEELNFLIFRYLLESGFTHSAFTFGHETLAYKSAIDPSDVPSGALISLIQKGVQLLEVEARVEHGPEGPCRPDHSWAYELLKRAKKCARPRDAPPDRVEKRKKAEKPERPDAPQFPSKPESSFLPLSPPSGLAVDGVDVPPHHMTCLQGHEGEVFTCCWHPTSMLLATGSGDATARIWTLDPDANGCTGNVKLAHDNKEVTTLDWSADGKLLATGSYDGVARLWTEHGALKHTLKQHTGPIFSLKFNKEGRYLLTGSVDNSAIIWDTKTGRSKQQFAHHAAATLDVDWKDEVTFASCSQDMAIFVCRLGETAVLRRWVGHTNEVNACKWDTEGHGLLASCSDDRTAKVWAFDGEDAAQPRCDFTDHTREIYTLKWSPGRSASVLPLLLATASFDCTVRLWDVQQGRCQQVLARHSDAVYSVAFSPDGRFLASGASDKYLNVWSVKSGTVVRRYKTDGGIFEVGWDSSGTKVACSCTDRTVRVLDLRL